MNSVAQVDEYDFDWTKPTEVVGEKDQLPKDYFKRAEFAKFLTKFLTDNSKESYVLNVNADWGAGKTYFLRRWQLSIQNVHPTAYINAWKNDFDNDPLLTVISEVFAALEKQTDTALKKTNGRTYREEATNKIKSFIKGASDKAFDIAKDVAVNAANTAIPGVQVGDIITAGINSALEKKSVEILIDTHRKKAADIESFKKIIEDWIVRISELSDGRKKPMFVFIDELDRCRPTYAIEMLEVIKHLFDIKGLVFIIATNGEQLQHSIKAVYGEGFDSSLYLTRFFDRSCGLKKQSIENYILNLPFFEKQKIADEYLYTLVEISEEFGLDLRSINLLVDQFESLYVQNFRNISLIIKVVILALKIKYQDSYLMLKKGMLEINKTLIPRSAFKKTLYIDKGNFLRNGHLETDIESLLVELNSFIQNERTRKPRHQEKNEEQKSDLIKYFENCAEYYTGLIERLFEEIEFSGSLH